MISRISSTIDSAITVGLLGGSFNPPHGGHLEISLIARHYFSIDQIWWLLTPQNPLKEKPQHNNYHERLALCQQMANIPGIIVTEFESRRQLKYSYQAINHLIKRYRRIRFVWIIGGDNLITLHKWKNWQQIIRTLPILVIDRPGSEHRLLAAKACGMVVVNIFSSSQGGSLPLKKGINILKWHKNKASSSEIRKSLGK